jgi:hypothetical protein
MAYLLLIVAVVAVLVLFVVLSAARQQPDLKAIVDLSEDGDSQVVFSPAEPSSDLLLKLLLAYGAKIRWLLNNEPPAILDSFRIFAADAADLWDSDEVTDLLSVMPSALEVQKSFSVAPPAVAGGEQFVIRLLLHQDGSAAIINSLPKPGLSVNIAWHFVYLMQAVRARLPLEDRRWSQLALQAWVDLLFSSGDDRSLRGLQALTREVHAVYTKSLCLRLREAPVLETR